ncbi:MAG TPA: hypothetical protein VN257_11975, partial [Actinotalea sp.]|nr:hypothetical protein [Actinotalea sp.]
MSDAPAPAAPDLPPGVRVRGGRGGTRARLEDLARASVVLGAAAGALHDASDAAAALLAAVDAATVWSP